MDVDIGTVVKLDDSLIEQISNEHQQFSYCEEAVIKRKDMAWLCTKKS